MQYDGLRFNSQFPFCSFPFVLDTYSSCNHQCLYCFSYYNSLLNQALKNTKFGEDCNTISFESIKKIFENPTSIKDKLLHKAIEKKIPIHWGGITDPFSPFEKKFGTSLKIARYLADIQYPYIVSTKGSLILEDEYKKVLADGLNIIQISLISPDEDDLRKIELGVSANDRLDAIEYYASIGKKVVVRLQPFIPRYTEKTYERLMKEVAKRGAKAITTEFLKIPRFLSPTIKNAFQQLSKGVGYNIIAYYQLVGEKTGSDIEIKAKDKIATLLKFRETAKKYGLEFYCADNSFRHLGLTPMCCGLAGNEKGFEGARTCTTAFALFKAMGKEYIFWEDVDQGDDPILNCPFSAGWLNQENVKTSAERKNWSYRDLLRKIWNTPNHSANPTKFYVNLTVAGRDDNGNIYYKWIDKFPR